MSKRALSLDDLVNHDENDKNKLQKLSEEVEEQKGGNDQLSLQSRIDNSTKKELSKQPLENSEQPSQQEQFENISNVSEISNDNANGDYDKSKNGSDIISGSVSSNDFDIDSDETDTDDEFVGSGEVNFDAGMTFNYDKQDRDSPKKKSSSPISANEITSSKSISTKQDEKVRKIPISPKKQTSIAFPAELKKDSITDNKETLNNEVETSRIKTEAINDKLQEIKPIDKEKKEKNDLKQDNGESPNDKISENTRKKGLENSIQPVKVNNIFEEKPSSTSKRNTIKKDLQVLQEIASASKPNKYKNVPIWARKWKPTLNALQQIDSGDFKLDPSFLNIIPDDDLTKSVQDWVYATIFSIDPEVRQFIELEMKFGIIREGGLPDRINPPISSQAIYTELDAHMTPNIDEVLFKELNKYIRGIGEMTENSGKFSVIESTTKDSVYRVGIATQRPRFLRMSTDTRTGRIGHFIEKRHIAQLLLYSPKDSYDVKISLNLELPVPDNDPPEKYQSQTPTSIRTKERVSYIHNDSCTRIDVTRVVTHSQNPSRNSNEISHEVELEINTPALITAFDNITNDGRQYAELIRTFLNNGTIIRRKLTSLSAEIFEGTKK